MFDCTLLEDGYLKCKACSKTFFTKGAFKIHSIKEHGPTVKETNEIIPQVGLQSIEKTEKNKLEHLTVSNQNQVEETGTTHTTLDPLNNTYETQLFDSDVSSLISGNKKVFQIRKTRECHICEKVFTTASSLREHISAVHLKLKPNQCQKCGKTYMYKTTLEGHIKTVHEKEKPFKCEICMKSFKEKNLLNSHKRYAHGNEKGKKWRQRSYE